MNDVISSFIHSKVNNYQQNSIAGQIAELPRGPEGPRLYRHNLSLTRTTQIPANLCPGSESKRNARAPDRLRRAEMEEGLGAVHSSEHA